MKKGVNLVIISLCLITLAFTGCNRVVKNIDKDKSNSSNFGIYLVKGENKLGALTFGRMENETYIDGKKVNLDNIELEEKPLITDKDIKKYYWKTHKIELNDEFLKRRNLSSKEKEIIGQLKNGSPRMYGGSILLNTTDNDSVVIMIDGNKIYSAGFPLPMFSSRSPSEIIIDDSGLNSICISNQRKTDDIRADRQIYDFFKKAGKLVLVLEMEALEWH